MAMAATATTLPSSSSSSFWSKEQFVSVSQRGISISVRARKPLSLRASSSVASPPSDANLDTMPRLKGIYVNNVIPALSEEFKYGNVLQVFFCLLLHSFDSLIPILFSVSS